MPTIECLKQETYRKRLEPTKILSTTQSSRMAGHMARRMERRVGHSGIPSRPLEFSIRKDMMDTDQMIHARKSRRQSFREVVFQEVRIEKCCAIDVAEDAMLAEMGPPLR